jgi:hypothetical protein
MTLAFLNKRDLEEGFFDDILAITSDALDSDAFARDALDSDALDSDAFARDALDSDAFAGDAFARDDFFGEPFIIARTAL